MTSLFEFPGDFISVASNYALEFFQGIKLLVLLLFAIGTAFWVLEKFLNLSEKQKHWYTRGGFEEDPFLTEEDKEYFRRRFEEEEYEEEEYEEDF